MCLLILFFKNIQILFQPSRSWVSESRGEGTDKQTHGYKQRDSEKDKDRETETAKVYEGRGQCMCSSGILKEEG